MHYIWPGIIYNFVVFQHLFYIQAVNQVSRKILEQRTNKYNCSTFDRRRRQLIYFEPDKIFFLITWNSNTFILMFYTTHFLVVTYSQFSENYFKYNICRFLYNFNDFKCNLKLIQCFYLLYLWYGRRSH